eukprot:1136697-Pelagomonas_calceolata.AAC.8
MAENFRETPPPQNAMDKFVHRVDGKTKDADGKEEAKQSKIACTVSKAEVTAAEAGEAGRAASTEGSAKAGRTGTCKAIEQRLSLLSLRVHNSACVMLMIIGQLSWKGVRTGFRAVRYAFHV